MKRYSNIKYGRRYALLLDPYQQNPHHITICVELKQELTQIWAATKRI